MLNIFRLVVLLIFVLVGVAYVTLLERKLLGYIQMRKGPNKVGFVGILQPFSDAIKLFRKEIFKILKSRRFIYFIRPLFRFLLIIVFWILVPYYTNIIYINNRILNLFILMGFIRYMLIFMGWSSNSLYSILGTYRSISQVLSYEVRFIIIILRLNILREGYSFLDIYEWQKII